jgi:hypothetical protein
MISLAENPLVNSGTQYECHGGGGGDAALSHFLEDIVARLGEAAVLAWTICLPGTLTFHNRASHSPPAIDDAKMELRVAETKSSMSLIDAVVAHDRVIRSP